MPFTHTTRSGKTYYLHTGPKCGGGVQHFLSTSQQSPLADAVPEGFEVHETVNGQVYLRRARPALIHAAELACVRRALAEIRGPMLYAAEVDQAMIVIHESTTAVDFPAGLAGWRGGIDLAAIARQHAYYQPVMRFVLEDKTRRRFRPERYRFRGSVDDWIAIGQPAGMGWW